MGLVLVLLGLSRSRGGGGGAGAFMAGCGMSGGVGVRTRGVARVTEGVERGPAPSPPSEAFRNLSSSSAALDWIWRTQRHLGHINMC